MTTLSITLWIIAGIIVIVASFKINQFMLRMEAAEEPEHNQFPDNRRSGIPDNYHQSEIGIKASMTTDEILRQGETVKHVLNQGFIEVGMKVGSDGIVKKYHIRDQYRHIIHSAWKTTKGNFVTIVEQRGKMSVVKEILTGKMYWHKQLTLSLLNAEEKEGLSNLMDLKARENN